MYKIADRWLGLTVCLPDRVIPLSGGTSQSDLRKLAAINYPGVYYEEEVEETQGDDEKDGGVIE